MREHSLRHLPPISALFLVWGVVGCEEGSTLPSEAPPPLADITQRHSVVLPFREVSGGEGFSCGLRVDGQSFCWGRNTFGQLGDGTTASSSVPVPVGGGLFFAQISAGGFHACGLTAGGDAYCWGRNRRGQLGDGTTTNSPTPVPVSGVPAFASLTAGWQHTCGLTPGGVPWCWGYNSQKQLGFTSTETCAAEACSLTPQAIESGRTFVSVDAGFFHTCGVTPGNQGLCWGGNGFGELGTGIVEPGVNAAAGDPTPQPISGGLAFRSVSAGAAYTCGVTTGDVAYCWGASTSGQLGNGRSDGPVLLGPPLPVFVQPLPVPVAGNFRFARIETHQGNNVLGHTCGVITNQQAFCWGDNRLSELGAPSSDTCIFRALSFSCSTAPVPVSGGFRFLDLAVMSPGGHVCGVSVVVHVLCWGDNTFGQLGDGTTTDRATPTEIVPPDLAPGRAGSVAALEKRPDGWEALLSPRPFE